MQKHEVKILSYIRNFKKVLFICPLCRENNSVMLENEEVREVEFRCDGCLKKYIVGFESLDSILKGMKR